MNIYVSNLPASVSDADLMELFIQYGTVASITMVKDRFTGQSKGFGFVDMPDNSQADVAIKALNKSMYKGRDIKVIQSQPPPKRSKRKSRRF
ncbi:MAG: RNA recognition motif domain-containing protein [Thermodesulfobacteriota bacterium]